MLVFDRTMNVLILLLVVFFCVCLSLYIRYDGDEMVMRSTADLNLPLHLVHALKTQQTAKKSSSTTTTTTTTTVQYTYKWTESLMIVFSVLNIPIEERFMWTVAVAKEHKERQTTTLAASSNKSNETKKRGEISINEKKCYR